MRRAFPAALLLFLLWSCNVQPQSELAAFGDSVTWGYGDLPGGWVRRVEQGSGYAISNLGIPGERSDAGLQRIEMALRTIPAAKVVFLLHGGNDWVHIFTACHRICDPTTVDDKYEAVASNIRDLRAAIHRSGRRIVFLTYWPSSPIKCRDYTPENFTAFTNHRLYLDSKITAVAAEHGDKVIHLEDIENFGAETDFFDCLHPSPQGYKKIASRILDEVGEWGPADPSPKDLFKKSIHW